MKNIIIKGARENNLKNISVEIPRNQITCFVGVSGSGKSTLAYNILYSEGQRQFLESISTFAARLLNRTQRPDVDKIVNLSPTISIDQKQLRGNPRSTVGTSTEIYTYLRLLFSRFGSVANLSAGHFSFNNPKGACSKCKGIGLDYDVDLDAIIDLENSLDEGAVIYGNYKPGNRLYNVIKNSGKLDISKKLKDYTEEEMYFLLYTPRVEMSSKGQGFIQRFSHEGIITRLKSRAMDLRGTSDSKEKKDSPYLIEKECSACKGGRLNTRALSSEINGKNIGYYVNLQLDKFIEEIKKINIDNADELLNRIVETTEHLLKVKLEYLTLNRSLETLSGGEAQRLKLARELGNDLVEMVYILDEPTVGLHSYDCENIVSIIRMLKDKGNTVIVIEHDDTVMKSSDNIVELGPAAGKGGGKIVFAGEFSEFMGCSDSVTVPYIANGKKSINKNPRKASEFLEVQNANIRNLKNISCKIPLGVICTFTGVSGSGKSSLLIDVFAKKYKERVVVIDQKGLSGTARGNIVTYIGIFGQIREIFAQENNVSKSLFSFNSKGSCPECKGLGYKKIDMHFMGDVSVRCESCNGQRYRKEVLDYRYKGRNIHEVLKMTVSEAYSFFGDKNVKKGLNLLKKVGLGYIELGQSHDTFSGGEAQRLKLAKKLNKKGEIYILDEPTLGLHFADIERLMVLLNEIVDNGNTVLAIEHNIRFISQSDWIIDLGPFGGDRGGEIVAEGTVEDIMKSEKSLTGRYMISD